MKYDYIRPNLNSALTVFTRDEFLAKIGSRTTFHGNGCHANLVI